MWIKGSLRQGRNNRAIASSRVPVTAGRALTEAHLMEGNVEDVGRGRAARRDAEAPGTTCLWPQGPWEIQHRSGTWETAEDACCSHKFRAPEGPKGAADRASLHHRRLHYYKQGR